MNNKYAKISRRRFMAYLGIGTVAGITGACATDKDSDSHPHKTDGPMTMRRNHNTGDMVSLLGYGCMRLPLIEDKNAPNGDGGIDQNAVNAHVDYALAHGVNYFDTSPVYCKGRSEHAMGIALSRHPRESYFIATKMSNFAPDTWSRDRSIAMFENSLRELRTDYIDYMLLHSVGNGDMATFKSRYIDNGIMDYLFEQKETGRIRNIGFSFHGDINVFNMLLQMMDQGKAHWDFVQIQLNYIDWHHANEINKLNTNAEYLYGELQKRDIPAVIMEPLLGGRLASLTTPIAAKLKQRRPDDSAAAWAFRYAGSFPGVLTVLSGMTHIDYLKENIATFSSLDPVTEEEVQFLDIIANEIIANNEIACTDCRYCLPCPYGINIPAIFQHYNKCLKDDNVSRDRRDPRYDKARRAFLVGYDRAVEKLRQADRCIACGDCISKCPQSIAIPAELTKINRYIDDLRNNRL